MAMMPGINFRPALNRGGRFASGLPIGLVLHRTEVSYAHALHTWTVGPNPKRSSAHFLVGKNDSEVTQLVDTSNIANHARDDANQLFLGVEFESVPNRSRRDNSANLDGLTAFQCDIGWQIVDWIYHTHGIRKEGPPTRQQLIACNGRWNGVLSHYDLANSGLFRTDHEDEIMFLDYMALSVAPNVARNVAGNFIR